MKTALIYKLLWLRHCWWFTWAHKPLCRYFHEDVLNIGTLRLCRSCTAAYGAGLATVLALWLCKVNLKYLALGYAFFLPITLTLSWPPIYKRLPRIIRDILRATLGAAIPTTAYLLLGSFTALAAAGTGCFVLFWRRATRKRHQHKVKICECCSELSSEHACSGYQQQLASIRCFQDEAMLARMRYGEWPPQIIMPGGGVEQGMSARHNSSGYPIQQ
jgi:hypothetical protein